MRTHELSRLRIAPGRRLRSALELRARGFTCQVKIGALRSAREESRWLLGRGEWEKCGRRKHGVRRGRVRELALVGYRVGGGRREER